MCIVEDDRWLVIGVISVMNIYYLQTVGCLRSAGVAQSVERVALIVTRDNLKVVGSSPTFGYSYQ